LFVQQASTGHQQAASSTQQCQQPVSAAAAAEQTAATTIGLLGTDRENKCAGRRLLDRVPMSCMQSHQTILHRISADSGRCNELLCDPIGFYVAYLPRIDHTMFYCLWLFY